MIVMIYMLCMPLLPGHGDELTEQIHVFKCLQTENISSCCCALTSSLEHKCQALAGNTTGAQRKWFLYNSALTWAAPEHHQDMHKTVRVVRSSNLSLSDISHRQAVMHLSGHRIQAHNSHRHHALVVGIIHVSAFRSFPSHNPRMHAILLPRINKCQYDCTKPAPCAL